MNLSFSHSSGSMWIVPVKCIYPVSCSFPDCSVCLDIFIHEHTRSLEIPLRSIKSCVLKLRCTPGGGRFWRDGTTMMSEVFWSSHPPHLITGTWCFNGVQHMRASRQTKLNCFKILRVKSQAARALTNIPWRVLSNCLAGFWNNLIQKCGSWLLISSSLA